MANSRSADALLLVDDPYFVSAAEVTGHSIVSELLIGPENYVKWRRSMEIALSAKSKLGFVKGEYPKPSNESLHLKSQKCNDIVMSWMINSVSKEIVGSILHASDAATAWLNLSIQFVGSNETRIFSLEKDLANLSQGELSVSVFYQKSLDLWHEYEAMECLPVCIHGRQCACYEFALKKQAKRKLIQFLMGLNDSFVPLRTHILAMMPLPSLNVVYAMALQDEAQRNISTLPQMEALALYVQNQNTGQHGNHVNYSRNGGGNQNKNAVQNNKNKRNLYCSFCQMNGHTKEICYKLVGYPVGHRFYKGPAPQNQATNNRSEQQRYVANNVSVNNVNSSPVHDDGNHVSNTSQSFSQEQIQQIIALIQQSSISNDKQTHMTGPTAQEGVRDW